LTSKEVTCLLGLVLAGHVRIACEPEAGQETEMDWETATAVLEAKQFRLSLTQFRKNEKFLGKYGIPGANPGLILTFQYKIQ
jgi:hypothetical protein